MTQKDNIPSVLCIQSSFFLGSMSVQVKLMILSDADNRDESSEFRDLHTSMAEEWFSPVVAILMYLWLSAPI